MIPKIIHYCWFGFNKKPKLIKKCIESWHKYLPDWQFIEWNELNYNINKNEYIREAYRQKKWAFVSDYARFDILNQYGGVYLDTDVELLREIPENFLENEAFTGFQSNFRVAPGLIYGSIPQQYGLQKMLDVYTCWNFENIDKNGKNPNILDAFSEAFKPYGLELNGKLQTVCGIKIYPSEVFCCYNFETLSFDITNKTISIHHYFASWLPLKIKIKNKLIKVLVRIFGKNNYLKIKHKIMKNGGK